MNITYISPYFWPERIGSAPYCTDLCDWLSARGHALKVIAFRPHYPSPDEFKDWWGGSRDVENRDGTKIYRIAAGGRGNGGFKDRLWNDLRFFFGSLRLMCSREVANTDAIVAYVPSSLTLVAAAMLAWRCKVPIIAVVHDIESGLARALGFARNSVVLRAMQRLERFAYNRSDTLIVLTDGMAGELRKIGYDGPISVLPIWSSVFPQVPVDAQAPPIVAYSGNFGKKQGLNRLIPLLSQLQERMPEVKIVLRGGGSERSRLERRVAELGLSNVEFQQLVPADQLTLTLQAARVHLVPQADNVFSYALPSKVISIMAAGRPFVCLAERGSPLDEIASKSGGGIRVDSHDDEAIFDAVHALLRDPALSRQMGECGRRFVIEHMGRDDVLDAYERIILGARFRQKLSENRLGRSRPA